MPKVKFQGFAWVNIDGPCKSVSLPESKLKQLSKEDCEDCRFYATKHLVRIYPAWYRVDSSNYDPQDTWEAGCQVAALNHQGSKRHHNQKLWLNAGKFLANFGCGFVPKPPHIMCMNVPLRSACLTVTVLIGVGWEAFSKNAGKEHLCRDSLVCVELAGARADRKCVRTSVYPGSHLSEVQPYWMESFDFLITDLDLAVLIFSAWDPDSHGNLLGQYAFPVQEVRQGWRRVPLLSSGGDLQVGNPALLCCFKSKDHGNIAFAGTPIE